MITRREFLVGSSAAAMAGAMVAAAGVVGPVRRAQAKILPFALVMSSGEVLTMRTGTVDPLQHGIVSPDGTRLITAKVADGHTAVAWYDLRTGEGQDRAIVVGAMRLAASDVHGDYVVLVNDVPDAAGTDVVLAGRGAEVWRSRFADVLEPELVGLSEPGIAPTQIFALRYLPGEPAGSGRARYEVHAIDTVTSTLAPVLGLRTKVAVEQTMRAQFLGRTYSPSQQVLLSLYRGTENGATEEEAFVHVLSPWGGVYCLDLPEDLGVLDHPAAMAVTDGGDTLLVASSTGRIVQVNLGELLWASDEPAEAVSTQLWQPVDPTVEPLLAAKDGAALVVQGTEARWVSRATLGLPTTVATFKVPKMEVVAIASGMMAVGVTNYDMVMIADRNVMTTRIPELVQLGPATAIIPLDH